MLNTASGGSRTPGTRGAENRKNSQRPFVRLPPPLEDHLPCGRIQRAAHERPSPVTAPSYSRCASRSGKKLQDAGIALATQAGACRLSAVASAVRRARSTSTRSCTLSRACRRNPGDRIACVERIELRDGISVVATLDGRCDFAPRTTQRPIRSARAQPHRILIPEADRHGTGPVQAEGSPRRDAHHFIQAVVSQRPAREVRPLPQHESESAPAAIAAAQQERKLRLGEHARASARLPCEERAVQAVPRTLDRVGHEQTGT